MKRWITAILLALCMTLSLLPCAAFAEEAGLGEDGANAEGAFAESETPESPDKAGEEEINPVEEEASSEELGAASTSGRIAYRVAGGNIYFDPSSGAIVDCDASVKTANIPTEINGIRVVRIDNYAFYYSGLSSVSIPDSVISIGDYAFSDCDLLTNITIPNSVTSIGDYAFYFCASLTRVIIPSSVKNIGTCAFSNCFGLTSVNISSGITTIENGLFQGCNSLTNITIPNSVKCIGVCAFSECSGLIQVTIPDSVTSIEAGAFSQCSGITRIIIPNSVICIGANAFAGCNNLADVAIPNSVTFIEGGAFSDCGSLTSVIIPNSVTSMGDEVFWGCKNLSSVTIPNSITSIGDSTFSFCNNLTRITIPRSVTNIAEEAFWECISLIDIFYGGAKTDWAKISIADGNASLTNATFHYNSTGPGGVAEKIPVHSTDERAVLDAALTQADLTNLFENVTLDIGKLRGPTISVAGKTFDLFEIDSKLELPFKKLPIEVSVDGDKKLIKVLLGFKEVKGDMTIIGDHNNFGEDSRNDFWKSYTDAKDLSKVISNQPVNSAVFRSQFQDLYDGLQELNMDFIVKAKGRVCGYAEFSYETGELKPSEGSAVLMIELKETLNHRIATFPAAYVTLRFEVSAEGKIRLVVDEDRYIFDPAFDAALKTAIGLGLGKNTGKFQAYVEGGYDGELGAYIRPMWKITNEELLSIDMTGNLYLAWKMKAWLFETGDTYKKQLFKFGLYPRLELLSESDTAPLTMDAFLVSAEPVTRDYLYAPSLMSITDDYSFRQIEYPYAEPTLLRLRDGRMLMVWVGDNGQKTDADRTSIFYSVYSGGSWSSPVAINESGTYQDHPVLYQDGGTVYAVWMQADTQLSSMEAQEAFRHLDLMFSAFDGTSWSEPVLVSTANNALSETDYALAVKNGTVAAVWIENSENDMLMGGGTNTIYLRTYENGTWGGISTIYESTSPIFGLDIDLNSGLQVSWSVSSGETVTAFLRDASGNLQSSAAGNQDARWIDGSRYELHDTELYRDGAPTGLSGLTNYEIVSSDTQTAVLTLVPTGFACELYGSYYDAGGGTWGPWVQLTGFNKYIRSYSAVLDGSGKLVVALNLVNADSAADEVYNNANAELVVVDDCRYTDLAVEDWISYDDSLMTPGGTLPLSFRVTNNSLETLTSVTVDMNRQRQALACSLPAGESAVLTADYVLPAELSAHRIDLTVTPDYTASESDTGNNSASVQIGNADLAAAVSAPKLYGGGASVEIQVSNHGYADAENVVLKVYRSNLEGEVLCTQDLGQIAAGQNVAYTFQIPVDLLFLDDPDTLNALSCEAVSSTEERQLANNMDRIVFGNLLPLQVFTSAEANGVKFSISAENRGSGASDSTVILALYSADDKMLAVWSKSLTTAAGESGNAEFVIGSTQYPDAAKAKVFWVDAQLHTPITPAWQGAYPVNS